MNATNITVPTTLTLEKVVTNDNGGTAVLTNWTLTATGATPLSGVTGNVSVTNAVVLPGLYTLAESGGPAGYTSSTYSCVKNGGGAVVSNTITLDAGDEATCTITNDDIAPALHLRKTVINDNDGAALNTAWTLTATGTGGSPTNLTGNTPVDSGATFKADTYTLSESGVPSGYTASAWVCVGGAQVGSVVTIAIGESATCTITNDDISPVPSSSATLHIIKHVINDNGGTATAGAFTINIAGTNVSNPSFTGSEAGVDVTLDAGSYTVTEPIVPAGYLQTGSGDCSGTITAGETKTCTITNNDIAPQLIVNKVVVNDSGASKVIADFSLFIDGFSVTSGVVSTTTVGSHTVSETPDSGYTSVIGGNCATDGTITLALGDIKTCTITNNDIAIAPSSSGGSSYIPPAPPLIDVVKVPSPLSLPNGPGTVKYTYTLSNIGTVPVSDITMVGDTCSPIVLISGDTNSDARLDVDEIWVHTCSIAIAETHTNTITAIGWANGISATDIANATVIVGIPVVPPLIHVTKVPNPLLLSVGGGAVTYTNKVTNPGIVPLSNVRLTDDMCGPVNYISGDTNSDSKLDITEIWVYTCQTNLTNTTVNTVTVSGEANSLTARDFAIVTVVVTPVVVTPVVVTPVIFSNPDVVVPKLPSTGLHVDGKNILWCGIMPVGIFGILILSWLARRKQISQSNIRKNR